MLKTVILKNEIKKMTFEEIYEYYQNLTKNKAGKWQNQHEFDDMKQIADIGLWYAYKKYDYKKGYKFNTLANIVIEQKLLEYNEIYTAKKRCLSPKNQVSLNYFDEETDIDKYVKFGEFESWLVDRTILKDAISKLDKECKKYIDYFLIGFTPTEIAKIYGTKQNIIFYRTQKAFKKLKDLILN